MEKPKNPRNAGRKPKGDKPKVQFSNRIDATLAALWKEKTGNKVVHLECALLEHLDKLRNQID